MYREEKDIRIIAPEVYTKFQVWLKDGNRINDDSIKAIAKTDQYYPKAHRDFEIFDGRYFQELCIKKLKSRGPHWIKADKNFDETTAGPANLTFYYHQGSFSPCGDEKHWSKNISDLSSSLYDPEFHCWHDWRQYPKRGRWVRDFFSLSFDSIGYHIMKWINDHCYGGYKMHIVETKPGEFNIVDLLIQFKLAELQSNKKLRNDRIIGSDKDATIIEEKFSHKKFFFLLFSLSVTLSSGIWLIKKINNIYALYGGITLVTLSSACFFMTLLLAYFFPYLTAERLIKLYISPSQSQSDKKTEIKTYHPQTIWRCTIKPERLASFDLKDAAGLRQRYPERLNN